MNELDLAVERGQLVTIAHVESRMVEIIGTTKARVPVVQARVVPDLVPTRPASGYRS